MNPAPGAAHSDLWQQREVGRGIIFTFWREGQKDSGVEHSWLNFMRSWHPSGFILVYPQNEAFPFYLGKSSAAVCCEHKKASILIFPPQKMTPSGAIQDCSGAVQGSRAGINGVLLGKEGTPWSSQGASLELWNPSLAFGVGCFFVGKSKNELGTEIKPIKEIP